MGFGYWPERRRLRTQPAKMRFLQRVARFSLRDGVRRSDILRELRVEPLLLSVKRSKLRWWSGCLISMPQGRFLLEVFQARLSWWRTRGPGLAGGTHCLGTPLGSPGGAWKHCWQEEVWKNPGAANRKKIEWWMDKKTSVLHLEIQM